MPVAVFATINPKTAHFEQARAAINEILVPTRAEQGCLTFEFHEAEDGKRLHLYEIWTDQTALDFHHDQDYTKAVFQKYEDWLATPVSITVMRPVV